MESSDYRKYAEATTFNVYFLAPDVRWENPGWGTIVTGKGTNVEAAIASARAAVAEWPSIASAPVVMVTPVSPPMR